MTSETPLPPKIGKPKKKIKNIPLEEIQKMTPERLMKIDPDYDIRALVDLSDS